MVPQPRGGQYDQPHIKEISPYYSYSQTDWFQLPVRQQNQQFLIYFILFITQAKEDSHLPCIEELLGSLFSEIWIEYVKEVW